MLYFVTFELRMEITLELHFVFFVFVTYLLLCHNYVIYLFDVLMFFYDVFLHHCKVFLIRSQLRYSFVRCTQFFYDPRITLYFGMFELHMEVTLQLRFVFVRHCNVFFITSQLRYLFVLCSYLF